jgi:hypothetical protein
VVGDVDLRPFVVSKAHRIKWAEAVLAWRSRRALRR